MGYQFEGKCFLELGANLESREAHTNPKDTQVPPPPGGRGRLQKVGVYYKFQL